MALHIMHSREKNPFVAQCKPDAIYIWAIVLVRGGTSKLKLESW
jgi:hypothetical protein